MKFYASLGNHDDPSERFYKPFNMNGERYYTFKPANSSVRFFALDSNYMDDKQLTWLDEELAASGSDWKICFFHHPPYSSGETHGSDTTLRDQVEPVFVKHGVNVVLHGPRALLRAHQAAEGDRVLHRRQLGEAARGQHRACRDLEAKGFDQGYTLHAGRDRRG